MWSLQNLKIAVKDVLGLPVNYPPERFQRFMATFDQSTVDATRIASLARTFAIAPREVEQYVSEGLEHPYSQKAPGKSDDDSMSSFLFQNGSPMGLTDRLTRIIHGC